MTKNSRIIIDSNYYLALSNRSDSLHQEAVNLTHQIEKNQAVISDYIFSEIMTVASQKISKESAAMLGSSLLNNPLVQITTIDHSLFIESWHIFSQLKQKNISFVNCSILAMMKQLKIKKLLSFDHADFSPLQKQFNFELI
ncbi:MAG: putative ribonuclease VapC [Microgenomates bacterium 39_7]|nr:MAG: putative ribonuclease VapC [Microgenomates bacterium 39_7]